MTKFICCFGNRRRWKVYGIMCHKERYLNVCRLDLSGLDQDKLRAVVR